MKKLLFFIPYLLVFTTISRAQYKYTRLHIFNDSAGRTPYGSLVASGSELFGMTSYGGPDSIGCIFKIDTNGNGYSVLLNFDTTNGEYPYGDLIISGTTLYGMTSSGGANGLGCIFSIQTNGSGYAKLLDFNLTNGARPLGTLTLAADTLYGMTDSGGAYNYGCIFSIQTNGTGYKKLLDFNSHNGANPQGSLVLSGKTLFGTTEFGGTFLDHGYIFAIQTNGTGYRAIDSDYNMQPLGSLILSKNVLYGTSYTGYTGVDGYAFSIDTGGYDMNFNYLVAWDLGNPTASLVLADSILYGMLPSYFDVSFAYSTNGLFFKIDTSHHFSSYNNIITFWDTSNYGWNPYGTPIYYHGSFYAMTSAGPDSAHNYGVIFKLRDTASLSSGIKQLDDDKGIVSVFPNPSTGKFTIKLSLINGQSQNDGWTVEVYNTFGERIYFMPHPDSYRDAKGSLNEIDLSSQPNGVYLIRILNADGTSVGQKKVVKAN